MKFVEYGNKNKPTIVLIHDAGLSFWCYLKIKEKLEEDYHIVLPILDGHDETDELFISIEEEAKAIMSYIHNRCDGHIYAIAGLALGGKIALEVLSKNASIANYAIIESVDFYPTKGLSTLAPKVAHSFANMVKLKWFALRQAQASGLPKDLNKVFYESVQNIETQSIENMIRESYRYQPSATLKNSQAKTLIIFGEKEATEVRKSARAINEMIPYSQMYQILGMGRGEFSLQHPTHYTRLIKRLFKN